MSALQVLFTLLFALFWLLALGGHLVLLKLLLTPAERAKLRLPAKAWLILLSITLADLAALLLGLPFTALFEIFDDWLFGSLFCHLAPFVKTTAVTVSAYGILALLLQCFEIACKAHRPKTPPATLTFLVAVIWVLALVTALPLLIAPAVRVHKGPDHEDLEMLMFEHDLEETETTEEKEKQSNETLVERQACYVPYQFSAIYPYSLLLELLVQFIVPLVMVIYLFIKTADAMSSKVAEAKAVRSRTVGEQQQQQTPQLPQISKHDVIFVRTVLILSVVYHLLRTPYFLFENLIFVSFSGGFLGSDTLWYAYTVLAESTYFIKPFLLLAVNGNFQNALRTIGSAATTDTTEDANQVDFNKLEEEPVTP